MNDPSIIPRCSKYPNDLSLCPACNTNEPLLCILAQYSSIYNFYFGVYKDCHDFSFIDKNPEKDTYSNDPQNISLYINTFVIPEIKKLNAANIQSHIPYLLFSVKLLDVSAFELLSNLVLLT